MTDNSEAGIGAIERVGVTMAHPELPQRASHSAPIAAQPSKAIAMGPTRTQATRTAKTIMPRAFMALSSILETRMTLSKIHVLDAIAGAILQLVEECGQDNQCRLV